MYGKDNIYSHSSPLARHFFPTLNPKYCQTGELAFFLQCLYVTVPCACPII